VQPGSGELSAGFGELGPDRGEGMVVERRDGLHTGGQALGERPMVEGERDTDQGREYRGVVGVDADGFEAVELIEQRPSPLALAPGEEKPDGGVERERDVRG
jgi:hypothetical protein